MTNKTNLSTAKAVVFSIILISVSFLIYMAVSGITGNVNKAHAASCGSANNDYIMKVNGYETAIDQDEIPTTYLSPSADTTSLEISIEADGHDDKTHFLVNDEKTGICDGADTCEYSNDSYSFDDGDKFTAKSRAGRNWFWGDSTVNCESSIYVRNRFGLDVSSVSTPTSVTLDSNLDYSGDIEWWSGGLSFEYMVELVSPDGTVKRNDGWNYLGANSGNEDLNSTLSISNVDPSEDYKLCITARDRDNEGVQDTDCSNVDIKSGTFVDLQGNNTDDSIDISWGESVTLDWNSSYASNCEASYEGGDTDMKNEWTGDISNESSDGMTFGPFKKPGEHKFTIDCDGTITVPPAAPSNFQTDVTVNQYSETGLVDLSWTDNATLETYFELQKYENDSWNPLATVGKNKGGGTVTYRDTGVEYGRYNYRVRACNSNECSRFTVRSATVSDPEEEQCEESPCERNFDPVFNDEDMNYASEDKSFLENIFGFLGLEVKAQEGNVKGISDTFTVNVMDGPNVDLKINGKDNSEDDPKGIKLEPDEKVTVTWDSSEAENCEAFINPSNQQDVNWEGAKATSNTSGIEVGPFGSNFEGEVGIGCDQVQPPEPEAPDAPSDLNTGAKSTSEIGMSWTDNSNNESRFEIRRTEPGPKHGCGGPKNWIKIGETDSNVSEFTDKGFVEGPPYGLEDGKRYCYKVRACNDIGCSSDSRFEIGYTYLESPTNLEAATGACSVRLSWKDNSENENEYQVFRRYKHIGTVNENLTIYDDRDDSLTEGQDYVYSVRACNSFTCSQSNYDSATYSCEKVDSNSSNNISSVDKVRNKNNFKDKNFNININLDSIVSKFKSKVQGLISGVNSKIDKVNAQAESYDLSDTVPVYVESRPPVVESIGSSHNLVYDQAHTHSPSSNPVASASDPDGDLKSYKWSLIKCADYDGEEYQNCPALTDRNGNIGGSNADIEGATYTPKEAGHYTLELEVTDQAGNTDSRTVVESTSECSDGIDNEGDGLIDYGSDQEVNDPDCDSLTDDNESAETPGIFDFFFEER